MARPIIWIFALSVLGMPTPSIACASPMISFAVGSTHLNANDLSVIDGVVADWRAQQHKRIVVSAGADKTGSASLNARLADQRGEAIKAALMRRGVPRRAILVDTSLRGQRLAVIEIVAAPKAPSSTCG